MRPEFENGDGRLRPSLQQRLPGAEGPPEDAQPLHATPLAAVLFPALIDGKAKHSPTNEWDTNAVWVDARRAMTVAQERHTEPQDKTLSQQGGCHTS